MGETNTCSRKIHILQSSLRYKKFFHGLHIYFGTMVALDCSEPLLKMDEASNQELKKSKKKKKNKHKDSESPKDDSIKISKAHAMNGMNSHVENLSKKKKHKKSKCTEELSIESNEKDKKNAN